MKKNQEQIYNEFMSYMEQKGDEESKSSDDMYSDFMAYMEDHDYGGLETYGVEHNNPTILEKGNVRGGKGSQGVSDSDEYLSDDYYDPNAFDAVTGDNDDEMNAGSLDGNTMANYQAQKERQGLGQRLH